MIETSKDRIKREARRFMKQRRFLRNKHEEKYSHFQLRGKVRWVKQEWFFVHCNTIENPGPI